MSTEKRPAGIPNGIRMPAITMPLRQLLVSDESLHSQILDDKLHAQLAEVVEAQEAPQGQDGDNVVLREERRHAVEIREGDFEALPGGVGVINLELDLGFPVLFPGPGEQR